MRALVVALVLLSACTAAPASSTPDPYAAHPRSIPVTGDGANALRPRPTPEVTPSPSAPPAIYQPTPSPTRDPFATVGARLAAARGDFDCDGRPDQIEFFQLAGNAPLALPKLARLTLATGAVHELALEGTPGDDAITNPLLGIADVNGDGCDDAVVAVGHGASTTWTSFVVYDGADLQRVEENGAPVMFLLGGSVRHGNAIECRRIKDAPEIVARAVSDYTSAYSWDLVEDVHRWSTKSRLVLWATTRGVIPVSAPYTMPTDSDRYWGMDCGAVKFGG